MTQQSRGTLALILLTFLYGAYGVYNRFIGEAFQTFSAQWVRSALVIGLVLIITVALKLKYARVRNADFWWIAQWLFFGSWIMIFLFLAFNHLQLATTYFLFYAMMILSGVVCGKFFFQEKMNLTKNISVVLSLIGVASIYSFSISRADLMYAVLALLAGVLLGFWNTISKKFSSHYPELQMVLWDAIAGALVGVIGFLIVKESLPTLQLSTSWIWLVVYSVSQVATVGLVIYGFKHLEAQVASLIMPIEIIFASLFGYLIFGETLTVSTIFGGCCIALAAFLPYMRPLLGKVRLQRLKV